MKPRPERGVGRGTLSTPPGGGFRSGHGSTPLFIRGAGMARSTGKLGTDPADALAAFPLEAGHWRAVVEAMGLSPRQAEIAELMIRGAQLKEIAAILGIEICTIRNQQDRMYRKAGVRNHEFFAHVLGVSHRVRPCGQE